MCTLTFVPDSDGYTLAMNRDERIDRGRGEFPQVRRISRMRAIYPSLDGRTWIGANEYGIAWALLNWNKPSLPRAELRSRGLVIPALANAGSSAGLTYQTIYMAARDCAPFRLICIVPDERLIVQWNWDGLSLASETHKWRLRHWFSSRASDARVAELRGAICVRASKQSDSRSLAWLRSLHRSHENGPGPFSICVHREQVETLSYTEVSCTRESVSMRHSIGSPCHSGEIRTIALARTDQAAQTDGHVIHDADKEQDVCRF